jgi:hypothetical protein
MRGAKPAPADAQEGHAMQDIIMLAIVAGFFALTVGYAFACEWF